MVDGPDGVQQEGWRYAREVMEYLKLRGAKIPTLGHGEKEWADMTSDGEGGGTPAEEMDEMSWVPRRTSPL